MPLFSQPYIDMLRRFSPTNIKKYKVSFSAAVQLVHLHTNIKATSVWLQQGAS